MSVGVCHPIGLSAWAGVRTIGQYGGDFNKTDCVTESTPYAHTWYRELQNMRGSAYNKKSAGLVHAENLAIARSEAARTRAAERLTTNAIPGTADEKLGYWVKVLGVVAGPNDDDYVVRTRCAAHYKAGVGPTIANEDAAIAELLGPAFVRCWRQEGTDLATPPTITYWPGVAPGPAGYSLGGGCWLSERSNLVVEVTRPPSMSMADFLRLMNVDLYRLLDTMLPAWATFNWAMGITSGFALDVSELDYVGMTP
jgi:hypothetical protein